MRKCAFSKLVYHAKVAYGFCKRYGIFAFFKRVLFAVFAKGQRSLNLHIYPFDFFENYRAFVTLFFQSHKNERKKGKNISM